MQVEKPKKGKQRANCWINRQKARYIGTSNKGKFSKPPKHVKKQSKRGYFRLTCISCKKIRMYVTVRTKKLEIVKIRK